MSCEIGLYNAIEKILGNKPWFKFYKEKTGSIHLLDSPKEKINYKSSIPVAIKVADTINKTINFHYPNIGTIARQALDTDGRGFIEIKPTNGQLDYLNSRSEEQILRALDKMAEEREKEILSIQLQEKLTEANEQRTPSGDIISQYDLPLDRLEDSDITEEEYESLQSDNISPVEDAIDLELKEIQEGVNQKVATQLELFSKEEEKQGVDEDELTVEEIPSTATTDIKPGVEELFESNPELANEVYSKILTNSGLSAKNLLSLLLKENLIEKQCS